VPFINTRGSAWVEARRRGERFNELDPARRPGRASHAQVAGLPVPYYYRVVVTFRDPASGRVADQIFEYTSSEPLSPAVLRERAESDAESAGLEESIYQSERPGTAFVPEFAEIVIAARS